MKRKLTLLLVVTAVSFVATTWLFWLFEHGRNPNLKTGLDLIYWWTVTSSTVGYGDIVPTTWQGKVIVIAAIVTGFFIFANLVAVGADFAHGYLERKIKGKAQVDARNHVVICEYTAVADELIQSLPSCPDFAKKEVVIVSDLVQQNPYPEHHFVSGVPISPASLMQANVEHADSVFIFANHRFSDPDLKTLHIAARARKLNPRAAIFVEMVDPQHKLLQHAGDGLIVLDSGYLMECALRDRKIDPSVLVKKAREDGNGSPEGET